MIAARLPALVFAISALMSVPPLSGQDAEKTQDDSNADVKTTERQVSLGASGSIVLLAPESWDDTTVKGPGPTIRFRPKSGPKSGPPFEVLVTVLPAVGQKFDAQKLRGIAEQMTAGAQDQAVEEKLELLEFKGQTGTGYYFSATDRAPKPDEFKYLSSGILPVGDRLMTFTLLSNENRDELLKATLGVLSKAAYSTKSKFVRNSFPVPKEAWGIEFEGPQLKVIKERTTEGGYAVLASAGPMNVSIHVEKPRGDATSHQACYEFYWPKAKRNPLIDQPSAKVTSTKDFHRVQYVISPDPAGEIRMTHVNYFLAHGGRWIDVHVSFAEPLPTEAETLSKIDKSLRVAESEKSGE